jgi:pre-rRNA-processing protein IPI1
MFVFGVLQELISKLRHFNETIKSEACQDLKDFIAVHTLESTHIYLSSILQTSSALIQDRERKVRRAATKLLATILEKVAFSSFSQKYNNREF